MTTTLLNAAAPADQSAASAAGTADGQAKDQNQQAAQQAAAGQAAGNAQQNGQQQDQGQGQDQQAAKPAAAVVPEKYTLKLPDKAAISEAAIEKIAATAKDLGLSQEQAEKLLVHDNAVVQAHMETLTASHQQQASAWVDKVKADPEIGGAAFDANISHARRAIEKFATPDFKAALDASGFGNHPELVRVFVRIGKAMSEDRTVQGQGSAGNGAAPTPEEILYPKTK